VPAGDLLRQHVDALVVEWWEAAEERVEHTAEGPHIHALRVPLVFDDFWSRVTDGPAWRHRLLVPNDLRQTEISDLDAANAASPDARYEFALVLFLLVILTMYWVLRRNNRYPIE
jgi:hypothetical protein